MCDTCGCGDHELVSADVHQRILAGNDRQAAHSREHFRHHGVVALNVMGPPGSGKTAVLEATARALTGSLRLGALAGDLATNNDAVRLARAGIPSVAISTGSACHLDAKMVHRALPRLAWHALDYLFIENIGNLVCPAIYDLGQAANVVTLAITEGDDKPLKYPVMFRNADLVLLTKIDLLPYLPQVRVTAIRDALARVMPRPLLLPLSAVTGQGVQSWLIWLESLRSRQQTLAAGEGQVQ